MPVQSMQQIAEHSLFKAALPLICAILIGSITWIFVTVMDLDKVLHKIEESEMPQILSLIHILRCRRYSLCRSRWSPYH